MSSNQIAYLRAYVSILRTWEVEQAPRWRAGRRTEERPGKEQPLHRRCRSQELVLCMNVAPIVVSFSNSAELNQKTFFRFFSPCWMPVAIYVHRHLSGLAPGVTVHRYLPYWNSFLGYLGQPQLILCMCSGELSEKMPY